MASSADMIGYIEDSSCLDYAMLTGTSILKDISNTVTWNTRKYLQVDTAYQPRRLESSATQSLWKLVIHKDPCALNLRVCSVHAGYDLIVNLVSSK